MKTKATRLAKPSPAPATVFLGQTSTPQGDGSFIVRPGRPVARLTPTQLASVFGVDRDSVYRWIDDGTIDPAHVMPAGKRKLLISAAAVPALSQKFELRLR